MYLVSSIRNIPFNFDFTLFLANDPILYPLKTPENLWFSCVFGVIKWEHWPEVGEVIKYSILRDP